MNNEDMKKLIRDYMFDNSIAKDIFCKTEDTIINHVFDQYEQKHRFYHGINHIYELFSLIGSFRHKAKEREILQLVALFHDVVYDPRRTDNEEMSANFFVAVSSESTQERKSIVNTIKRMILETQYFKQEGTTNLSKWFNEADLWTLIYGDINDLIKNEKLIFKEYQFRNYQEYKIGRLQFLNSIAKHKMVRGNGRNIRLLINYVQNYVPNIGIYAGSFNPFHIGHKNILSKADKLFDKVIVAVGQNAEKEKQTNDVVIQDAPLYEIHKFDGALSEYIKSVEEYAKVTLVRGLRNGYDFAYEINQLRFIEDMYGGNISVVFIPCDREYDYISSSAIRGVEKVGGDFAKRYLIGGYQHGNCKV